MQVLVLTHNILSEEPLQRKLQSLNHEVLCSSKMLELLQQAIDSNFACYFYQVVILSENLTNKEVLDLLPRLEKANSVVMRKVNSIPDLAEKEMLENHGIVGWVTPDISTDVLRELLAENVRPFREHHKVIAFPINTEDTSQGTYAQLYRTFSKTEKKVFEKLYSAEGRIVSREEFCQYLWKDETTNSHLSQLSVLIKNVRRKISNWGLPEEMVVTIWGQGYRFAPGFYEYCPEDSIERAN
ncbi:winged helix-turn-helix domain-containing protein [Enterococcus sp. 669A]|uniref:Winged helix-turn-helix domain-containing protein n=1 Tax=Candidatus Enterococcus moelleringii TaxID=2815325 RepID=A0ABS3LB89_9ENTE|nr:winged helix-turn-helix domain-containing protein [Enterococcus sp. 669A]MBO1306899.1 winged helix-turn-helix domain-containing protein [Enterococcus sp. 669A]